MTSSANVKIFYRMSKLFYQKQFLLLYKFDMAHRVGVWSFELTTNIRGHKGQVNQLLLTKSPKSVHHQGLKPPVNELHVPLSVNSFVKVLFVEVFLIPNFLNSPSKRYNREIIRIESIQTDCRKNN